MVFIWQFAQEPSSASSAFQFSLHWPNFTAGPSEGGRFWSCASSCSKLPAVKCTWAGEACPMSRKNKHAFPHLPTLCRSWESTSQCKYTDCRMGWETGWKTCCSEHSTDKVNMALASPLPGEVELTVIRSTLAWTSMPCHNNLHQCGTVLYPPTGKELLNQWRCCVP